MVIEVVLLSVAVLGCCIRLGCDTWASHALSGNACMHACSVHCVSCQPCHCMRRQCAVQACKPAVSMTAAHARS